LEAIFSSDAASLCNVVEQIAKLAGIRQAKPCRMNIAVEANMCRPVLDFEAIERGSFGLVLMIASVAELAL
jgi:hypothetical protein